MKIKIYTYDKCGTCKKALKFLEERGSQIENIPIVDSPPTLAELKKMWKILKDRGEKIGRLFNTSGELYREMKMGEKIKNMKEEEALALLSKHGKLIKRPFVLAGDSGLVGFDPEAWKDAF